MKEAGARAGFLAAAGVSLGGVAASFVLLRTHAALAAGELPAYCTFGPGLDCSPVLLSPWSEFAGFPLPVLSLGFYVLLALLALQGASRVASEPLVAQRNAGLILLAALLATAQSARLAWISDRLIGSFCPFCVVLYVVSGLLLACGAYLAGRAERPWREVVRTESRTLVDRPAVGVAVVAIVTVVLAGAPRLREVYRDHILAQRSDYRVLLEGSGGRIRAVEMDKNVGSPWEGPSDAKASVVIWLDYFCPYCRMLEYEVEDVAARVPFRRKYLHYPHEKGCNPYSYSDKQGACLSSLRGVLAARAGHGPAWRAYAFAHARESADSDAARVAAAAGIPPEVFAEERTDTSAIVRLVGEIQWARRVELPATPFVMVNGLPCPGLMPTWFLERWIRAESGRSTTAG